MHIWLAPVNVSFLSLSLYVFEENADDFLLTILFSLPSMFTLRPCVLEKPWAGTSGGRERQQRTEPLALNCRALSWRTRFLPSSHVLPVPGSAATSPLPAIGAPAVPDRMPTLSSHHYASRGAETLSVRWWHRRCFCPERDVSKPVPFRTSTFYPPFVHSGRFCGIVICWSVVHGCVFVEAHVIFRKRPEAVFEHREEHVSSRCGRAAEDAERVGGESAADPCLPPLLGLRLGI